MSEVRRCATTMSRQRSIKKLKLFKDEPIKEINSRTPESYGPRGVRSPLENISNKTPSPLNEEIKRKTPQSSKSNGKLKTKSQFEQLEKEGLLTLDILDQFKNNQDITVVNMTPSFAPIKNEIGLVLQSKGNVKSCTKPFYHGFKNLLFLDITRVPIHDDEIRYLIRLCKLRGLSLSYTEITFKGMKYLSHHAQFKDTLEVLKLAGIEGLDDSWLPLVQTFTNLNVLNITDTLINIEGLIKIVSPFAKESKLSTIQCSPCLLSNLISKRTEYLSLADKLIMDKSEISVCDKKTLKSQLVYFKRIYPEVVMKFNKDYGEEHMRTYLCSLIDKRAAEETLWRIME